MKPASRKSKTRSAPPGQSPISGTRVELSGRISRRDAEALRLAIRQLAERHNVVIGEIRVERRDLPVRRRRP